MNPEIIVFGLIMGAVSGFAGYGATSLLKPSPHRHQFAFAFGFGIYFLVGFFMFNKVVEIQREKAKVAILEEAFANPTQAKAHIVTDTLTGCEYVQSKSGCLSPRLNKDGNQVCSGVGDTSKAK